MSESLIAVIQKINSEELARLQSEIRTHDLQEQARLIVAFLNATIGPEATETLTKANFRDVVLNYKRPVKYDTEFDPQPYIEP